MRNLVPSRVCRVIWPGMAVLSMAGTASAQFHMGFSGGIVESVTQRGVSGLADTKFKLGEGFGVSSGYRFSNGVGIAVRAARLRMGRFARLIALRRSLC